jgi:8-oxo-dGTP pyrophosphatase MutT (NUDIX family)
MTPAPDHPHQRIDALARALRAGALPGDLAKKRMWPDHLPERPPILEAEYPRRAAVLVLLYPHEGRVCFPLMRRTVLGVDAHSGQISLPGGSREPQETPEQTALREAHEELGIRLDQVRVLGRLSPHFIPVSGFRVVPVVATAAHAPDYRPDPKEVDAVLVSSLDELDLPGSEGTFAREIRGRSYDIPCWRLGGSHVLWGATAMILAELLAVARSEPKPRP